MGKFCQVKLKKQL